MNKRRAIVVGVIIAAALVFYFSKSGFWNKATSKAGPAQVQAQAHQHGTPAAKPPEPAAEKPAAGTAPAEEAATEAPTIEIPEEKQQMIGVKTATVSVQPLTKMIRTVGFVEYDQRRLNTINTKVEGWIEKLYVNFTGTYVKKGEPVADIYSPELWATQQEFINVVRWAKRAQPKNGGQVKDAASAQGAPDIGAMIGKDAHSLVEAARQRLKLWDITDAQIRKIEESERPIRTLTVYSPYSGYVLQKNVTQGMRVMPGANLLELADLSSVWITADIYEFEMPLIKVGDAAFVQLSYFPGRQFSTKIDYIYPTLQGETRTLKARFTMPNEGGRLKPQMFTNVELKINLGKKLAVPSDAVINTGVRQVVYVDKGGGNFEPREVVTGVQTENLVEVTAGLRAGDKVASSANFLIDSEAKLKGVEPLPRQKPRGARGAEEQRGEKPAAQAPPQHRH
ncbi:MAG: Cation efflux system protein CusB precursor [Syntrophorhabdaceae bacterium PtaU1.Bin034]|nr:MAG: Cation efflux system protein CusB precursor [Syntrophorhabdaceae bacterium PtaU1.Bin034]